LWPIGLADGLSDAQLEAVLAHELSHVRRRDNLGSACHVIVETLFWFHPVVWWLGAHLLAERERACDQDVVSRGCVPATYAESLLKDSTFCLESRAACLAGVTGSGLVSRIEAIMMHRPQRLGWPHTLLLAAAGVVVVIAPIAAGARRADSHDRHLADAIAPWVSPIQSSVTVAVVDAPRVRTTPPAESHATVTSRSEASSAQPSVQNETGRVTGVVTDQTGAPLADATATAISRASGSMRPAVSSADGKYTISYLVPGTYDVRVEHVSFKSVTQRLEVGAGAATTADVRLPIGGVSDVMKVVGYPAEAHAPVTDPLAEARARDQIVKDPAAASNYFDLAKLYYLQERFAESEQMVARAVELVDQQAGATPPAASGPALRGGDVKEPRQIRSVPPVYPAAAIAARVAGVVILEAKISPTGSVKEARILQSVPGLDAAALGAIRQMLFTPTLLNGVPVEITLNANVIFELR
jgi:TonB family protein